MRYKILFLLSILFIISISAVSAEDVDNQTLGEIDDNIDIDNNILSDDILKANGDGTFNELEKILWRASDGDTITLDRDYYYDGSDRKVMGVYRQITIDGAGHTLDGKNGARIFYVGADAKSLTLKNINFVNAKVDGSGGAILNDGAKLTVTDCTFTNNRITGTTGGAIASNNADNVVIKDCKFSGNYATGVGGAVSINGNKASITNCVFTNNEARDYLGGAVLIYGNYATIKNNTFTNNKAGRDGGALDVEGVTEAVKCVGTEISDNTFTGNSAPFGGAVGLNGNDATISNNIFKSNKAVNSKSYNYAGIGGAMRLIGEKNINVNGNTFTDNTAYNRGGAFYLEGANSVISKNTFTNNHATTDAGGTMNVKGNGISVSENTITSSSSKNAGGAIFINGNNLKIIDNKISQTKSTASYGGALQLRGDGATISGNEFTQTTSKGNGGAMDVDGKNTQVANNILNKCTSEENGGGAYLAGSGSVVDNEITSCSAALWGGGICFKGTDYKLSGNNFKSNSAQKGSDYYPSDMPTGKIQTTLTATDVTTTYGTKNYVIATLKDKDGNPISNAKIGFTNNGVTYVTTGSDGKARYYTTELLPGTYNVNVKYEGDNNYDSSSTKAKVTINKLETKLTAKYDKNGKNIVATVKDANGKPISGLKVGFTVDGVKYVTTDANGQAKYSTANLTDGTYTVNVLAYGNEIYANSNKEKVTFTIGNKEQAKIYLRNALYFVLQTKIVTVTLWDANNNPIANKTVYITLDEYGSRYSGVTDENGNAYIRVGVGFGNHPATVSFEGDDQYFGDSKTGRVRVIKETPSLMLPGAYTKFKASDPTKTIKVYLKDRYNKPLLPGTKVFVTINGKQYVGSINTEGIASININLNKAGVYNVDLYYTGNTAYNAVRKTTKITIV